MKAPMVFLFWLCCFNAISQASLSLGPDLGLPSNFSRSSKPSFGGSIEFVHRFSGSAVGARFFSGFNRFEGKFFANDIVRLIPVRAGFQWFPHDLIFLYGEAGITRYAGEGPGNEGTGFSYGLGAGYRYPIGLSKSYLQLSAYYNKYRFDQNNNYSWFNIRLAYGLNFVKKRKADPE